MKKLRLFIENFLVYGLGGIISKIIPLIMVPIVTRLMPSTDYFGISDLSNTIVQFGSAIAVMGMYDAMYRMFFEQDDEEYKKRICSTAMIFTFFTSTIVFLALILFKKQIAYYFFSDEKYAYVVYLSAMATLVGATNSIISAPTRMQNKRKIFLVTNTVSPVLSYAISIPMLMAGYYTIALPLAAVVSGLTMELTFGFLNKEWFDPRRFDFSLLKKLLVIAVPLLPNFLIYWVFNSCDKLMITNMIGIGAAGIYSVGSKLGHCSQLIYTAFAGGWQYFAFSTMKEKKQVETNSRIYEYLGVISFIATAGICAISHVFFSIVFSEQYLSGYIIAPYLFISPLLQMLYQIGNNQFLVIKKTWPGMFILSSGAIVNVILNLVLIPILGIEGAAIATMCGYIMTCIIDIVVLKKCGLMAPRIQFLFVTLGLMAFFIVWRIFCSTNTLMGLALFVLYTVYCAFAYRKDIVDFLRMIKKENKS